MAIIKDRMLEWAGKALMEAWDKGYPYEWGRNLESEAITVHTIVSENSDWDVALSPWGLPALAAAMVAYPYLTESGRGRLKPLVDTFWRIALRAGIHEPTNDKNGKAIAGRAKRWGAVQTKKSVACQIATLSTRALDASTASLWGGDREVQLFGALALRSPGPHRDLAKRSLRRWQGFLRERGRSHLAAAVSSLVFARAAGLRVEPEDPEAIAELEFLFMDPDNRDADFMMNVLMSLGGQPMPPIDKPEAWTHGWNEAGESKATDWSEAPSAAIRSLSHFLPHLWETPWRQWVLTATCRDETSALLEVSRWLFRNPEATDAVLRDWATLEPAIQDIWHPDDPDFSRRVFLETINKRVQEGGVPLEIDTVSALASSKSGVVRQYAWLLAAHAQTDEPDKIVASEQVRKI